MLVLTFHEPKKVSHRLAADEGQGVYSAFTLIATQSVQQFYQPRGSTACFQSHAHQRSPPTVCDTTEHDVVGAKKRPVLFVLFFLEFKGCHQNCQYGTDMWKYVPPMIALFSHPDLQ